jgi:HEAT repeat protein
MRTAALAALLLLAVPSAPARAEDLPAGLPGLEKDAEEWFLKAGDRFTPPGERNDFRKKSWESLRRTRGILERHWEANPADRKGLRDRLFRAEAMAYWLRRECPVGLLDGAAGGAPGGGGRPDGEPSSRNPFDQPSPGAATDTAAGPAPANLEKASEAAKEWEDAHEADAPGVMQHWQEAMARFTDRWSQAPFLKAAGRAAKARTALKDWYRTVRAADPDSLDAPESPEGARLLIVLGRELGSQDSSLREKAARMLALLGSGEGAAPLGKALKKETEPQTRIAMVESLADLGGAKGAAELASLRAEKGLEPVGLDGLVRMAARDPVDRAIALRQVGRFALVTDEATAARAVDLLVASGPAGARGLEEALSSPVIEVRIKVMGALAATKDPRTARPMGNFLLTNAESPGAELCRKAAQDAIRSFGQAAVPFLFPALRNPRTRLCAGDLLREITGAAIGSGRADDWIEWWKGRHPEWKEE